MEKFTVYAIDDSVQRPPVEAADDDGADESAGDLALLDGDAEDDADDADDAAPAERYAPPPRPRTRVGEIGLDAAGMLSVVSADPACAPALAAAVADLNGRAALTLKLPPGPGDETFSIVKVQVPRGDPQFFAAVQDNLRRWHNMELQAET
jgi:hypothetical protein